MDIITLLSWQGIVAAGLLWGYINPATPEWVEAQQQAIQQQAMQPVALPPAVYVPPTLVRSSNTGTAGAGRRR